MKALLQKIVSQPELEARWLNTLSLLEHVGARKIGKTVCDLHPSIEVLTHHADEARHALVFKQLSDYIANSPCGEYLCHDEALSYFQMLDQTLSEWLSGYLEEENPFYNYLLVTAVIEKRALTIYPMYKALTQDHQIQKALGKIMQEEAAHRRFIESQIKKVFKKGNGYALSQEIEKSLFGVFESSLRNELQAA